MAISEKLLDELLKDYQGPEDLLGKEGIMQQLKKRLIERAMSAEMTDHLGYAKHSTAGHNSRNSRNGNSSSVMIPCWILASLEIAMETLILKLSQKTNGGLMVLTKKSFQCIPLE